MQSNSNSSSKPNSEPATNVGGGDVHSDKSIGNTVGGDNLNVGDMSSSIAAIGRGATVNINTNEKSEREELADFLEKIVPRRQFEILNFSRALSSPEQPYKYLDSYDLQDSSIFFGREDAIQALYQTVLRGPLTILHAKSGTGKTSLLCAGLSPKLLREQCFPIYARVYRDPTESIKKSVAPNTSKWPTLLQDLNLHEFLHYVWNSCSNCNELVIILDQFEEFFIFPDARVPHQSFIDDLANVCNDSTLPVRIVISIRKDYFSDISSFKQHTSAIHYDDYLLDSLTTEQAQDAITSPLKLLSSSIQYDDELLDILLDDFEGEYIEPPHIQIVCSRLYEYALGKNASKISVELYEQIGGVSGILGNYLVRMLERFSSRDRAIAEKILVEMVSSKSTRRLVHQDTLSKRIGVEPELLEGIIGALEHDRLLRRVCNELGLSYELTHEYIIKQIKKWITPSDISTKEVLEQVERSTGSWLLHRVFIPIRILDAIYRERKNLGDLSDETWQCILISEIHNENWKATRWLESICGTGDLNRAIHLLKPALSDDAYDVRYGAVWAIRTINSPLAIDTLVELLKNTDSKAWDVAATALNDSSDPRVVSSLVAAMYSSLEDVALQAVSEFAELPLGGAYEPKLVDTLIGLLNDMEKPTKIRCEIARTLSRMNVSRVLPSLINAISEEDPEIRKNAIDALGTLGDPVAIKALLAVQNDKDKMVRSAASTALKKLGYETKILELKPYENVKAFMTMMHVLRRIMSKLEEGDKEQARKILIEAYLELANSQDLRSTLVSDFESSRNASANDQE